MVNVTLTIPDNQVNKLLEIFGDQAGFKQEIYKYIKSQVIAHDLQAYTHSIQTQAEENIAIRRAELIETYGGGK